MVDAKNGNDLIGADQVRFEDDRQALRIAIRAVRQASKDPQMANVLRVLSLVAMVESTSALSCARRANNDGSRMVCVCVCALIAVCICCGLLRSPKDDCLLDSAPDSDLVRM